MQLFGLKLYSVLGVPHHNILIELRITVLLELSVVILFLFLMMPKLCGMMI
jgi:hypothetical protein